MTVLAIVLGVVLAIVLAAFGLAHAWANTPYGRLKPLFAFSFRLQSLFNPAFLDGVLVKPMETDEQRAAVRAQFLEDVAPLSRPVDFTGTVEDRAIDGPAGPIPVRVYRPSADQPLPLLVYLHGGGFIVGSPAYTEAVTRGIAQAAPAVVVSVDYRLAPENPFPAAVEDAEAVLEWCVEHCDELGADRGRIAVGGDSAGGNLSAVLAQRDRDRGRGWIGLQVLIYPAVDVSRLDRESQIAFASGYGLSRKDMQGCADLYVQDRVDKTDPGVSPLLAESLEGLAPALVFTAGFDVLRDEGIDYAERLAAAGVSVEHVHQPAMPHGYITMTRICPEAREDIERIAAAVRGMGAVSG